MLTRRRLLGGIVLAAILMFPATAGAATMPIVGNGSFEKPVVPPGTYQGFNTGQTFSHWKVVGASGDVDVISGTFTQNGFSFPARKGQQWLDLTGVTNTPTGVAQTVATTPGTTYTLRFYVGNVYDPNGIFGVSSTVNVFVNGTKVRAAVNTNGMGSTSMVWKAFSISIAATSASTTIEFINGDPSNDTANGLDAISMT